MKTLQLCISFAFVACVLGQGLRHLRRTIGLPPHAAINGMSVFGGPLQHGYIGRSAMKPPIKKAAPFSPLGKKASPFSPLGKSVAEPKWVRDLIGKTIGTGPIIGGAGGFPRHGGAGVGEMFADGLRNGWGGDPALQMHPSVLAWQDPLNNLPFPIDYSGQKLVMDPTANRWIIPNGGITAGHKVPKKTGYSSRRKGMIGGKPLLPKPVKPIMPKPIKPIMPKPIQPIMPKKPFMPKPGMGGIGGPGFLSGGPAGLGGKAMTDLLGSTISGKPVIGGFNGFPRHGGAGAGEMFANGLRDGWGGDMSMAQVSSVSAWQDPLGGLNFPHDYNGGKLTLDPTGKHYIEKKRAGVLGGVGGPGIGMVDPVQHNIAKKTDIAGQHIGLSGLRKQLGPSHGVEKALMTGKAQTGHDNLAVSIGQDIARQAAANAGMTIDMGSGGALSGGDPFASAAAHGLAKESLHVAGKLLNKAGAIEQGGKPVAPVMPGVPKPVVPVGGYGRTRTGPLGGW